MTLNDRLSELMVICPVTDQKISGQACLDHAMQCGGMPPPCELDYGILKAMFSDPERTGIHVTDLTGCLRRAWYVKAYPQPEYVNRMLSRHIGTMFHASVETTDEVAESEVPVAWNGLVGTVDRYYKDGRVVDYKTTKFIFTDRVPSEEHILQVNIYAYMLRKMGKPVNSLAIQYICLSGPTKCSKHRKALVWLAGELVCPTCGQTPKNAHPGWKLVDVPLLDDKQVEDLIQRRQKALEKALKIGVGPQAEPGWICDYCAANSVCPAMTGD